MCEALAASHAELDIIIEDAGETLDRLAALGNDEPAPLWITIDPFPAMVDAFGRDDPLGYESAAVGSSQLAVAFRARRQGGRDRRRSAQRSRRLCGAASASRQERTGRRSAPSIPGTLRPSLGDVSSSALGLVSFGSAVASYFDVVDVDRTQFDDTSFIGWLRRLSRVSVGATSAGRTPLATLAVRPAPERGSTRCSRSTPSNRLRIHAPGSPDGATGPRFDVNYSEPQMWIQAVIATPGGVATPSGLDAEASRALDAAGWDPASAADAPVPNASTPARAAAALERRHLRRLPERSDGDDVTSTRPFRTHGRRWLALGCALVVGVVARAAAATMTMPNRPTMAVAAAAAIRATASSSTWRSAARRSPSCRRSPTSSTTPTPRSTVRCVFVRPRSVVVGQRRQPHRRRLARTRRSTVSRPSSGHPPRPAWAGIVNERAGSELAPAGTPFMLTPLVIAMPQPMAEALGWPDEPIGFADLRELANDPDGWGSVGHPEWGLFRLGKTNPNYSTSGLNFTIAEYYAATGKTSDLTREDLQRPAAVEFATDIESSVVHYGDITMTFLNNWFAADARGTALTYASAVAIEEKSVIDYNLGDPDGVLAGRRAAAPAARPARGDLPRGGHALLRQPVHRARHRVGRRRRAGGRRAVRGVRPAAREPGAGDGVRVPSEQPRRAARPRRSSPRTASTRTSRRPSSVCPSRRCWSGSSTPGPSCARKPGCCSCSTSPAR